MTTGTIDLLGILSASRALSSETSVERLHERVVEVLSDMTGATGVELVLWSDDRRSWLIPGEAGDGRDERALPMSVLRYVQRTRDPLIVGDATADDRFARDPYFAAVGACSLLAVPIVTRGTLGAVLLLENRLLRGAFTAERLESVKLIAGQLAVSLENAQLYSEYRRIADEQAALGRVATLVAQGASPNAVFDAVAAEIERLLDADAVVLARFEPGDEVTVVAHRGAGAGRLPPGTRIRRKRDDGGHGLGEALGMRATSGVADRGGRPAVGRRHRGMAKRRAAARRRRAAHVAVRPAARNGNRQRPRPRPAERLARASAHRGRRGAPACGAGPARRRAAAARPHRHHARARPAGAPRDDADAEPLIAEALGHVQEANEELRELAHGILPADLARGGLRGGVDAVVERLDLAVKVDLPHERFPAEIEASAYFIVAEALTNIVKHAHARSAEVSASVHDGTLELEVRDDGIGGADPVGHGLVGMNDRVTALGGRLSVHSPAGGGTVLTATLPISPVPADAA